MISVNTKDWVTFLSTAKSYMAEANIIVKDNTARITGVDLTHTNMIDAAIPCEYDGELTIPVSLDRMVKALSTIGQEADIELTDGYMVLHGEHSKIKIPLLAEVNSRFSWPAKFAGEAPAQCEIDTSLLMPFVSYGQYTNAGIFHVDISDTKMTITIGEMPETSEVQSPNTAVGEAHSTMDLAYIELLLKNIKGGNVSVCGFGNNVPMLFSWTAGEGQYKVLVAPRIED